MQLMPFPITSADYHPPPINDPINLYIPPSYLFLGVRVTDIALCLLLILLAALLAFIVRLVLTGNGGRQVPWVGRRHFRDYRNDNHNRNGQAGRG